MYSSNEYGYLTRPRRYRKRTADVATIAPPDLRKGLMADPSLPYRAGAAVPTDTTFTL